MHSFIKSFAVAALLASTSTFALAQEDAAAEQDAGVSGAAAESEMPTEPPGADAADDPHADAAGVAEIDYEAIASSLQSSSVTATDIQAADTETNVQIVMLSELTVQAGENAAAVDEALASAEGSMEELRTAISDNVEVAAALGAQGYAPEDVVGVTMSQDDGLVLVVDDSQ